MKSIMNLGKLLTRYRHHHNVTKVTASLRAAFSRYPLPPGRFLILDSEEQSDQKFLLRHSEKIGPIFKLVFEEKLTICVVGLPLCRQFLQENADKIMLQAVNLEGLFPLGFLRRMEGGAHRKYRKALLRAIDPELFSRQMPVFEKIIADELARYSELGIEQANSPETYIRMLNNITSSLLITIFFGVRAGSNQFNALRRMYDRLGPHEVEWVIGEHQRNVFIEIRDYLLETLEKPKNNTECWLEQGIMGRMHSTGELDETSLGNLIYMVEIGRYDMRLLLRWVSKYGADSPELLERVRAAAPLESGEGIPFPEAFVLETLRLRQSEVLMRVVNRDIVFEGYQIPKNFIVRLCIWESHKLPDSFDDPFAFRPERFVEESIGKNRFAPFGLDHHSCPFGGISTKLSSVFIDQLARSYVVTPVGDSDPVRGRYHWQPANSFSIRLAHRRSGNSTP